MRDVKLNLGRLIDHFQDWNLGLLEVVYDSQSRFVLSEVPLDMLLSIFVVTWNVSQVSGNLVKVEVPVGVEVIDSEV